MTGQVLHSDARGVVAELVFKPHAMIAPHSNPNSALFIVVSGTGYVQVGGERAKVHHGEAVVWPADVVHGAYTEGSEMRAFVVELRGADDSWVGDALEGVPAQLTAGDLVAPRDAVGAGAARPAHGGVTRSSRPEGHESPTGEPW